MGWVQTSPAYSAHSTLLYSAYSAQGGPLFPLTTLFYSAPGGIGLTATHPGWKNAHQGGSSLRRSLPLTLRVNRGLSEVGGRAARGARGPGRSPGRPPCGTSAARTRPDLQSAEKHQWFPQCHGRKYIAEKNIIRVALPIPLPPPSAQKHPIHLPLPLNVKSGPHRGVELTFHPCGLLF